MVITIQLFYLVIGTLLVLGGLLIRGILVVSMSHSDYDRFSLMATWAVVAPAFLIGTVLVWLGLSR
jgi:uncharacterized membrane protein